MTEPFNACEYLLDRHVADSDGERARADRCRRATSPTPNCSTGCSASAGGLRGIGLQPEQRVLMVMTDSPDFVTRLPRRDADRGRTGPGVDDAARGRDSPTLLRDSRARLLAVSPEFVARSAAVSPSATPRNSRRVLVGADGAPTPSDAGRCTRWTSSSAADRPMTARLPDHRGLTGVLALHLGNHRHAQGRDAPPRVDPGGLRDVRQPRSSASARTTAACPRPRHSSPTA